MSVQNTQKRQDGAYNRRTDMDDVPYRTDIVRLRNHYDDLGSQIICTYKTYSAVENKVSPAVSRNADNHLFVLSKEWIDEQIGGNVFGMNQFMYRRLLESVERFYIKNRSTRRIPSPHIISHRSVHFCDGLFDITPIDVEQYLSQSKDRVRNFKVNTVHKIEVSGLGPFYIENMRVGSYKYLILRPKLGKSGGPQLDKWEILLFKSNLGYNVEHIDTDKNPRYNGSI